MKDRPSPSGVTLIEVVLAIVIVGTVIPVLLTLHASVARPAVQAEMMIRAGDLAHALLEEIESKRFDEQLEPEPGASGMWTTPLGPEAGETRTTYDDVDDFHGFSETLTGGLIGFSRSVQVEYLAPFDPSGGPPVALPVGQTARYKRITVTASGPADVSFQLAGLATLANSQMAPEGAGDGLD